MKVHTITECWGNRANDVIVTPYTNRKLAEKAFKKCVKEYLDGSDQDDKEEVATAIKNDWVFEHSDGFIRLETDEAVTK